MDRLTLIESGRLAHEALVRGGGKVCAVFRRSVYLRLPQERYVCLGGATLGRGPINGIVVEADALHALTVGERVDVACGDEIVWLPRTRPTYVPSPAALAANLRSLERAMAGSQKSIGAPFGDELTSSAGEALLAFDEWLTAKEARVPAAVHALLGFGPGLTPSGDDYLAGALVALRAIGQDAKADRLWHALRGAADRLTHPISRAHLAAAAAGEAHEAVHLCLEQLLGHDGARWDDPLARLAGVGHSSGWDGLAGAIAVARSALRPTLQ